MKDFFRKGCNKLVFFALRVIRPTDLPLNANSGERHETFHEITVFCGSHLFGCRKQFHIRSVQVQQEQQLKKLTQLCF
jgi:hypothetical protein